LIKLVYFSDQKDRTRKPQPVVVPLAATTTF